MNSPSDGINNAISEKQKKNPELNILALSSVETSIVPSSFLRDRFEDCEIIPDLGLRLK